MRTYNTIIKAAGLAAFSALALAGCSSVGDALGTNKYPPDEFAVIAKTPLVIPPVYNLRPPGVGNPLPSEVDTSELALRALFPASEGAQAQPSPGEAALLGRVGGDGDKDIRSNLSPDDKVVSKGVFTEELLYDEPVEGGASTAVDRSGAPAPGEGSDN